MVQPATKVLRPIGAGFSLGTVKREGTGGDDLRLARESKTQGQEEAGRSRVVLADDHPLARGRLKEVLGQQPDLEVVGEAQDGQGALDLCRRLRPEVVLMEARMPKMDGIEATRRIKREYPAIRVVLVMNTLGAPEQLLEALKAGAIGYVLKRSGPQRIRDAVRGALIGEYSLDEELTMELLRRLVHQTPNGSSS
jgi:two-component system, NarL family, response regulator DegU